MQCKSIFVWGFETMTTSLVHSRSGPPCTYQIGRSTTVDWSGSVPTLVEHDLLVVGPDEIKLRTSLFILKAIMTWPFHWAAS